MGFNSGFKGLISGIIQQDKNCISCGIINILDYFCQNNRNSISCSKLCLYSIRMNQSWSQSAHCPPIALHSAVGTATRYRMDDPGIEFLWAARFSAPVQTCLGAHPASYSMGTGSFPGVKRPGRGVNQPPSSAEVKERVELYLFSPSGPSWPVLE